MAKLKIKTTSKVVPQCYAYTTPGIPSHDGWTKIGFTERDVETRIKEQTHTVGVTPKIWWHLRAAYMTEPFDTFTDKEFHAYLKMVSDEPASLSAAYETVIDGDQTTVDSATKDDNATIVGIYSIDGTKRTDVQQGVNIVKLSNGKVQKVVKK